KVSDSTAQKVTKTGMVVGTPDYMSPEQVSGDALDARSDLYSLALVTFLMLTARLPFANESSQEAMLARLTDRPKTLAEARPDIAWPWELQSVLDRALARDASRRYKNAAEFAAALSGAVAPMAGAGGGFA